MPARDHVNNPFDLWVDMPAFDQPKVAAYATINVRVPDEAALRDLEEKLGQKLTEKTKSVWYPERPESGVGAMRWT